MSVGNFPPGRRGLLVGLAASLSGCGFRPVYGPRAGTVSQSQHELGLIDVALIPERSGQLLRQALQQRMASPTEAGAKRYELSANFGVTGDVLAYQQDSTATRIRVTATSTWSLKRLDTTNALVTNGIARALDGFNIVNGQYFASDLANEAIQRRLAESVADRITLQVAAFFAKQPQTS